MGIIGFGTMGKRHFFNCLRMKEVKVVGVSELSKFALAKAQKMGAKTFPDYNSMIRKQNPQAVIIALPNYLHKECALAASDSGCDIFVEKPLASSLKEGIEIANHVKKADVKLMVGMYQRFVKGMQNLKKEIEEGRLGQVQFASAVWLSRGPFQGRIPKWYLDVKSIGGGALFDSGCHLVDLFLWFFGEPKKLSCYFESAFNLGYDDYAEISLRFHNRVNTLAVVSWRARFPSYRFEVMGQCGRREVHDPKDFHSRGVGKVAFELLCQGIPRILTGRSALPLGEDVYFRELEYFIHCLLKNEKPHPDEDDSVKVLRTMDQAYRNFGSEFSGYSA